MSTCKWREEDVVEFALTKCVSHFCMHPSHSLLYECKDEEECPFSFKEVSE